LTKLTENKYLTHVTEQLKWKLFSFNIFDKLFFLIALANSPAVRFRTLPLRLESSIPSAVANFASACKYLC